MQANDDDDHDEYTWINHPLKKTPLTSSLSSLDSSLRCPICHALYSIPVSTPCHHTFCSECIRKSLREGLKGMKRVSICPVCRETVEERDLRPNRALDQVVLRWEGARGSLRETLVSMETMGSREMGSESNEIESDFEPSDEDDDDDCQPSPSPQHQHSTTLPIKRKSLPYFHGMKRKKLIDLCSSESLPTNGTDKDLRDRFTEFITLHNAECDATHPRPSKELVKEVIKREKARKEVRWGEQKSAALMEKVTKGVAATLSSTGKGEGELVVSSGNREFDRKMQDSFKNLVKNYRRKVEGLPPLQENDNKIPHQKQPPTRQMQMKRKREGDDDDRRIDDERRISTRVTRTTTRMTNNSTMIPQSSSMTKQEVTRTTPPPITTTSLTGPWQCEMCTYINQTRIWSTAKCEMCESKRPSLVKRRKNQSAGAIEVDC